MDRIAALGDLLGTGPWPLDGGFASELEALGHDLSDDLWSARLLADDPAAVRDVHEAYFAAGARIATTASYQASRAGFVARGLEPGEADRLLTRSVTLAQEAREEALAAGAEGPLLVAASVGPYGAVLAGGEEYVGRYGVPRRQLVDFHRERLDVLAAAGPDLLAVETVPDAEEAAAIAEVLADHPDLPAWVSFSCRDDGHVSAGQPIEEAVRAAAAAPNVLAVGVNCTAPEHVAALLLRAGAATGLPLVAYPNAGRTWDGVARQWRGEGAGTLPDDAVVRWVRAGAALVGGCCGLGPAAVASVARTLAPLRA